MPEIQWQPLSMLPTLIQLAEKALADSQEHMTTEYVRKIKVRWRIQVWLIMLVLAGCATTRAAVPTATRSVAAVPGIPLSAVLRPQQIMLPGSGVQLRWQMPEDRQDDGHGWTLTCTSANGVGSGSTLLNPPPGPLEVCGFGQGMDFFYGGVVFQPHVARISLTSAKRPLATGQCRHTRRMHSRSMRCCWMQINVPLLCSPAWRQSS